jgi:sporulation protein YlmC with PRC-barrel domain
MFANRQTLSVTTRTVAQVNGQTCWSEMMLCSVEDLEGYAIGGGDGDGDIGQVKDVYFDDESWTIRYFIVETGSWLSSRKVLISAHAVGRPNASEKVLPVALNRAQVENSPKIDTDKPVSRQHETDTLGYYGYPLYWGAAAFWGAGVYPDAMLSPRIFGATPDATTDASLAAAAPPDIQEDFHLRSFQNIRGYHVHATDGDIGHVQGMIVDEDTWAIRYLVVDTSNWWGGHKVLIAPQWINKVRWFDASVSVDLTRQAIKDAPPYVHATPVDRRQETVLYDHYDRPSYWADAPKRDTDISRI